MKNVVLIFLLAFFCCTSCEGQQKSKTIVGQPKERSFSLPEVPVMLDTPEARATFVCEHYWDNFDFADTAYIHLPDITEQAIVNFMDLMGHVPSEVESLALRTLYQKTAPHSPMLWYFWETMSRYWHDPNSPMKNEEKFIKMCKSIESLKQVEEIFLQRVLYARTLAEKNRIGINATDFVYTLASGKQGKLYDLRAEYILIFFYNPDCHTCTDIKRAMKNSRRLKDMVKSRRIMVLTVYPDENVELWREHLSDMANEWVNAYDKGQVITHEMLYDLSSIPSFYLLDKNKKVLLKDADWRQVLHFFEK
jgi:thioredoxin-related protein